MSISFKIFFATLCWISAVTAVWPQPKIFQCGSSTVWLSPNVQLFFVDDVENYHGLQWIWAKLQQKLPKMQDSSGYEEWVASDTALLVDAFERTKNEMFNQRFIPRKFHPRKSAFEPNIDNKKYEVHSVTIKIISRAEFFRKHGSHHVEEAYSLSVLEDGIVLITTTSVMGGLHAFQTFKQLFYAHSQSDLELYTPYAPITIVDGPRFKHRGLNLDISRNWIPPKDVLRVIEAMASNKLNRLHIHASDAQSWPIEISSLSDLAFEGAYDPSQIWSVADLHGVQQYGRIFGVEVYLEIDIPGHTTSISKSRPDLITAANLEPWPVYAAEPPSGQLKLNSTDVVSFLTSLFMDILPRTAPFSPLFHFGGDELNLNAYLFDSTVNSTSKAVLQPLLQLLINHVLDIAKQNSVTPIFWEEMLLEWNLTLPASAIIQTWRSNEALSEVLSKGHLVLFGANTHFYLDCGHGAFLDPADPFNPSDNPQVNPPYLDYCNPYHNWRHIYSYNPLIGVPDEEQHMILGGEVHLWGEMTDSITLDGMLWPRAAAAAEVLWRGPGNPVSEDTTRRLAEMRERLILMGIASGMVQMEWCLRNRGGCTL